jgi:hypothetical protein
MQRLLILPRSIVMKTFVTALMLVFALASGIFLITLAFRTDVREPAAGIADWTTWKQLGRN